MKDVILSKSLRGREKGKEKGDGIMELDWEALVQRGLEKNKPVCEEEAEEFLKVVKYKE